MDFDFFIIHTDFHIISLSGRPYSSFISMPKLAQFI